MRNAFGLLLLAASAAGEFQTSAGEDRVTSYSMPLQALAGVVNPFLDEKPGQNDVNLAGVAVNPCTEEIIAVTDAGPKAQCAPVVAGFAPSLGRMRLLTGEGNEGINVDRWVPLLDNMFTPLVGMPSECSTAMVKAFDPTDVAYINADTFAYSDARGPKVLIGTETGEVLATYVPQDAKEYTNENMGSEVFAVLPKIFAARAKNGGLSSLTVYQEGGKKLLAACMAESLNGELVQSATAAGASTAVRCAVLDITKYKEPVLVMQKVLKLESTAQRVADAAFLSDKKVLLLVTEVGKAAKLVEVNLATGDNIADDSKFNDMALGPDMKVKGVMALEGGADAFTAMTMTVVKDLNGVVSTDALTGLAVVNEFNVLLVEGGMNTKVSVMHTVHLKDGLSWTKGACPATAGRTGIPQYRAGGNATVATYILPSQPLAGEVNPSLTNDTKLNCFGCNRACNNPNKASGVPCKDGAGLSGLSFDACTGSMVAVTSRGPVQACSQSAQGFALPEFTPAAMQFELQSAAHTHQPKLLVKGWTEVKKGDNTTVTGLPFKSTDGAALKGHVSGTSDVCGAFDDFQPRASGLWLDEVHFLYDGMFIGVDQYAPKVVVWGQDGRVVATYVPAGLEGYTEEATGSVVRGVLPAIFAARTHGRGLAALAVHPAKNEAVVCMKAPMNGGGIANAQALAAPARFIRCAVLDIKNVRSPKLLAQKYHVVSDASKEYTVEKQGVVTKQSDVVNTAAAWLSEDKILLVERGMADEDHVAVLFYELDMSTGDDIQDNAAVNDISLDADKYVKGVKALEGTTEPGLAPVAAKVVVNMNSQVGKGSLAAKRMSSNIEGVTLINEHTAVLAEGNDFGMVDTGYSKIHLVQLNSALDFEPNCRPKSDDSLTIGQIIGICLGGALLAGILLISYFFLAGASAERHQEMQ
eukprot:TRINITY_DN13519_c0_g1_i1.p1 TRINITY_DN13519_c0_g1~~TRINITY_DN13519_c0_g1_i1.p1  ORF type:complete len:924 (+),score=276.58 TRINITY_DN13519_c0_g1_i1:69-2840(+)